MKPVLKISLLLVVAMLWSNCWKKQKHEIAAPKTPVYTVAGIVYDKDSNEAMQNIVVSLIPVEMLYDYDFSGAEDTTDANGQYHFDKITPGTYQIICQRNSYAVVDEKLVVEHKDKEFEIYLPKALLARTSYGPKEFPSFHGIFWKDANVFAGTGVWKENADDKPQQAVMLGDFVGRFSKLGKNRYTLNNPSFYALAYLGRFWATNGDENHTIMYSIDPARGNVDGETVTTFGLRDLTSDGKNLWATTHLSKIIKFGEHPSIVTKIYDVEASQPYGIAWSDSGFWISDFSENLVLQLDENMHVKTSYRPFAWNQVVGVFPLTNIKYMAFDFAGNLWANDGINVYKFTMP